MSFLRVLRERVPEDAPEVCKDELLIEKLRVFVGLSALVAYCAFVVSTTVFGVEPYIDLTPIHYFLIGGFLMGTAMGCIIPEIVLRNTFVCAMDPMCEGCTCSSIPVLRREEPLAVSDEEAREMVLEHLKGKQHWYPSDIATELNLDYDQVGRIIEQLEQEGVVGPHV